MARLTDLAALETTVVAMAGYRPKGPFPLFIKDLKEDTIGWDGAARWRYLCVLEHMFHQGGYIPDDLAYLAEISGTNRARNWRETLEKLRYILLKSDEKPGFLTNKRVLLEVGKAIKRSGMRICDRHDDLDEYQPHTAARRQIPTRLREEIWSTSRGICSYCGTEMARSAANSPNQFTIDHVIPLVRGGGDQRSNLLPACRSCNSQKGVN